MAAGTVAVTEENWGSVKKIKFVWTAGTDGDAGTASGSTTTTYEGKLIQATTVPGTGGTQPDDNYDVTLTDADSVDLLAGNGANRDETNTEHITLTNLGAVKADALTLSVSGAGASNTGTVYVYIR